MNNAGWNNIGQPSVPAGVQQQPQGPQQSQAGGQQQSLIGAQQQAPFGGQIQLPTSGQQSAGGQFVSRARFVTGPQQQNLSQLGRQQQPHSVQGQSSQGGQQFSNGFGGQQTSSSQFATGGQQNLVQPGRQQAQYAIAGQHPQGGQQFSNVTGSRRVAGGQLAVGGSQTQHNRYPPSGQQSSSNGSHHHYPQPSALAGQPPPQISIIIPPYTSSVQVQQRQSLGNGQQFLSPGAAQFPPGSAQLPPGVALRQGSGNGQLFTPAPTRVPSGPQQQQSRQVPGNNQQFLSPAALQFQHGVQDRRQFSSSSQQISPVPPQYQPKIQQQQQIPGSGYVISPMTAQLQPGGQEHFTSGLPNSLETQYAVLQTPGYVRPLSASAPVFQPGEQQHICSGQSSPAGAQFPGHQSLPHGQQFPEAQQHGQQYPMGQPPLQTGYESCSDNEDGYEGRTCDLGYENVNEQDADGDQTMAGPMRQDPLYQHTLEQVEMWKAQANKSMTDEEKANFAAYAAWKRKRGADMNNKRLANLGDCHFDEDEMSDAVRASKRPRRAGPESCEFYKHAKKVYAYGPPDNPNIETEVEDDNLELDGLALDVQILGLSADFQGQLTGEIIDLSQHKPAAPHRALDPNFRLIDSITSNFWLMIEITKHMTVKELIMLYSVSRSFHMIVNSRFMSTMAAWAQHKSPAGWKVFYWKFYGKYTHLDPGHQPWHISAPWAFPRPPWDETADTVSNGKDIRHVPGFKYLAMLVQRETRTRDILACLARSGHRLPATVHVTLKKIWMLMDMSTCNLRRSFVHNTELWTDRDLYNAQMFFVKLNMRFNEPIFGPNSTILADTFMGAREGLTALWQLLRGKRYHHPNEIIRRRIKYWVPESFKSHYEVIGQPYFDVSPWDLGQEHLEGWGAGNIHLRRPDELVIEECVRREIDMEAHLVFMVFWGHVDWKRRINLVPTEEEMYMSDDEMSWLPRKGKFAAQGIHGRCGNVPFDYDNWQPKHAMKARWATLTRAEKLAIVEDDKDEQLRSTVYEESYNEFWMPYNVNDKARPEPEEVEYEDESQQYSEEDEVMDWEEDEEGNDEEEDETEDDAASVESFFQQERPIPGGDFTVTYPLWPRPEEDDTRPTITKIEYEYVDDEPLQMPEDLDPVKDAQTIAEWGNMDPFLQQVVIDEQARLRKQDEKDERTMAEDEKEKAARAPKYAPATLRNISAQWPQQQGDNGESSSGRPCSHESTYHYEYPGITDPILLEMLRKYDRFAPEAFRCDEDGDHVPPKGGEKNDGVRDTGADSDGDFTDMDDEALKALANVDYDEDELDFDVDRYQTFLDRIGDDSGLKDRSKKVTDRKGKGKATPGDSRDDEATERMAHEKDLDKDDISFPEYEFRRY